MKYSDYDIRLSKRWYKDYNNSQFSVETVNKYLQKQKELRSSIISHMKSLDSQKIKITDSDFSFKTATLHSSPVKDIEKLVQSSDDILALPLHNSDDDTANMDDEQLKKLLSEIDLDSIDLEELEKIISAEGEDPSIGDDPNEKLSLGTEFNRKPSAKKIKQLEQKQKRQELKERLKEEKQRKRDAKSSSKKKTKKEESESEADEKEDSKPIVKQTLEDIMKAMNTNSKLNFAKMLLESRKKSEEDRKVKEEAKSVKKRKIPSKSKDDKSEHSDEDSGKKNKRQKSKEESEDEEDEKPPKDSKKQKPKKKKDDSDGDSDSSYS